MAKHRDYVLAGDIGGTNARLRLYDVSGRNVLHRAVKRSGDAGSLEAILAAPEAPREPMALQVGGHELVVRVPDSRDQGAITFSPGATVIFIFALNWSAP